MSGNGNETTKDTKLIKQPQQLDMVPRGDAGAAMAKPASAGQVTMREGADGSREMQFTGDTASASIAAQIRADAEMRTQRAKEVQRDWLVVRKKLLEACKRPRFAKVAKYNKPVGKGIVGPSIRFAEEAMRAMGNLVSRESIVHEDGQKRIVRASIYDFESNNAIEQDVTIEKTVESLTIKSGTPVLSQRKNSGGQLTYLVAATEDQLLTKKNAQVSKARRNMILQMLPGDILEDCMDAVDDTIEGVIQEDIVAERKQAGDGFLAIGVQANDLAKYIGRPMTEATAKDLTALNAVYNAIMAGEGTWEESLAIRLGKPAAEGGAAASSAPAGKGVAGAKAKAQQQAKAGDEPKADAKPERAPGDEG